MYRRVKKRFDVNVENEYERVVETFDLEKTITKILGLLVTSDRDDLLYYRGSQKIEINRHEIFPEDYQSKLLFSGINVPPDNRYYTFEGGLEPGNGKVTFEYKDSHSEQAYFTSYRVSLYLDCEIVDLV